MTAPATMNDDFNGFRSMIGRASWVDADQLVHNTLVMLDMVRGRVIPTFETDHAFDAVIVHAEDFRSELTRTRIRSSERDDSIEQARQLTLLAIDQLDHALTDAKPSEMAKALGQDWF